MPERMTHIISIHIKLFTEPLSSVCMEATALMFCSSTRLLYYITDRFIFPIKMSLSVLNSLSQIWCLILFIDHKDLCSSTSADCIHSNMSVSKVKLNEILSVVITSTETFNSNSSDPVTLSNAHTHFNHFSFEVLQ